MEFRKDTDYTVLKSASMNGVHCYVECLDESLQDEDGGKGKFVNLFTGTYQEACAYYDKLQERLKSEGHYIHHISEFVFYVSPRISELLAESKWEHDYSKVCSN